MTSTPPTKLKAGTPWLTEPPKTDPRIRLAQKRARRARRAGLHAEAGEWARLALSIAAGLARQDRAAAIGARRRVPVLLDPKGYSPSGIPNWRLNQQRLERAGLMPPPAYSG